MGGEARRGACMKKVAAGETTRFGDVDPENQPLLEVTYGGLFWKM
jgi:hypothetical protein